MKQPAPKRILFTGYAPVHFVCFLRSYLQLAGDPRVECWLSGGFKRGANDEETGVYDLAGFYDRFPVDHSRVIPIDRARQEDFDVLVCAHLSDSLFPRRARRTVQVFHGVSFKNLAVREKALRFDILCLPGRYHAELYQRQGLVRPEGSLCLVTGFPKVDPLVNGELDRQELPARLGIDSGRPTILYAPTGGKFNSLETMGAQVIDRIRAADRWNLLVKPHDHPKLTTVDWFQELAASEDAHCRLVRDWDVVPYLHAADLLITDASSVAVEYTLLDRPMIFLDVPKLWQGVVKRGAPLDLDTYGRKIGQVVEKPEDVVGAIAGGLEQPQREAQLRRAMARHVFHRPGTATQRVTGVIRFAAGLMAELPDEVNVLNPALGLPADSKKAVPAAFPPDFLPRPAQTQEGT
jgi:hypothetical protein